MRDDWVRLADVLDQIDYIEQDVRLGKEAFDNDRHLQDSIALRIGYVGEALSKTSKGFKERHPQLPWEEATAMRAKLFHDYFEIDKDIIWKTAAKDMAHLKEDITELLKQRT